MAPAPATDRKRPGGGCAAAPPGAGIFPSGSAGRPDQGRPDVRAQGNGAVAGNGLEAPGGGVLGGITGEPRAGAEQGDSRNDDFFDAQANADSEAAAQDESTAATDEENPDANLSQDADAMAVGPDAGEQASAEGALTDSLLGPPAQPEAQAGAAAPGDNNLRPWFVEVEVAPGQVQMLQLNAESPEHALAILRDFRGNPRVLRGPSPDPLP